MLLPSAGSSYHCVLRARLISFSASSSYHCVALVLHVIVGLQALPINAFPAIDIIVFFADAVFLET